MCSMPAFRASSRSLAVLISEYVPEIDEAYLVTLIETLLGLTYKKKLVDKGSKSGEMLSKAV